MPEGPERGQSPPPERSSGKQMHDVPGSGKGIGDASNKKDINKEALGVSIVSKISSRLRCANTL